MKKSSKIKPFNKEEYEKAIKVFEWDELAHDLIKLELEFENIKNHLPEDELKLFQLLIGIYENEKTRRVEESYDHSRRVFEEQEYRTGETELTEEDLDNM